MIKQIGPKRFRAISFPFSITFLRNLWNGVCSSSFEFVFIQTGRSGLLSEV